MDLKHAEKELVNRFFIHVDVGDNRNIGFYTGVNDKAFARDRRDLGHKLPDIGIL